jgi:hypothetical protein
MKARVMIKRALRKGGHADTPVQLVMPAPVEHADTTTIFRSSLLRTERDGCELATALDLMITRHPKIAEQVIFAGNLGEVSRKRAVASVAIFRATGVATAPAAL